MARPARITDADAKALRRLSGVDPRLKGADTAISGLQNDKLARDGTQDMTGRVRTVRAHAGASRVMAEYAMSDGDTIRLLIDTDGGVRWRNETTLTDLFKVHRTGKMELLSGSLGLPGDPAFPLEATPKQYVESGAGVEAWIAPTLLNGWTNAGGGAATAGYHKDRGKVYLKGRIASGTATGGTVLFTLPTGYRPGETWRFGALSSGYNTTIIDINSSGQVILAAAQSAAAAQAYTVLDGIWFRA